MQLEHELQRLWGFSSFRPGQRAVVEAVLERQPVLAIMPTGAGKSLCYQFPAAVGPDTTLVVSPLIALMKDQVESLAARGISATFINSHVSPDERRERFERLRNGEYRLIYLAPERLRHEHTQRWLESCRIDRMAIDEAHCISQWGHDFRPDYLGLRDVATRIGARQVCAFTATATPEVRNDILQALALEEPRVFVHGFRRDNLVLRVVTVRKKAHKLDHIAALAEHHRRPGAGAGSPLEGSGIVYAATRKNVEKVAADLVSRGIRALAYHAGLDEEHRSLAQDRFMRSDIDVIVATNAFGMGVDKPDTRFVVHHDVPGSLEAYYQEAGRAGRDGDLAECTILFSYADVRTQEFFIDRIGEDGSQRGRPMSPEEADRLKALERSKLRRMVRYCYAEDCRHDTLLRYFGDGAGRRDGGCGVCDLCLERDGVPPPSWISKIGRGSDPTPRSKASLEAQATAAAPTPTLLARRTLSEAETLAVRKLLSGVARGRGRITDRQLTGLLRGREKDTPEPLRDTVTFGCLSHWAASDLLEVVRALIDQDALRREGERPPRLALTPLGVEIMMGTQTIQLALPNLGSEESDIPADPLLFENLREARRQQAVDGGLPPFIVAHDSLLRRIAATRPSSMQELLQIKGVGPNKAEAYGETWLEVVRQSE